MTHGLSVATSLCQDLLFTGKAMSRSEGVDWTDWLFSDMQLITLKRPTVMLPCTTNGPHASDCQTVLKANVFLARLLTSLVQADSDSELSTDCDAQRFLQPLAQSCGARLSSWYRRVTVRLDSADLCCGAAR